MDKKINITDMLQREAKAKMIYAERGGHAAERTAFDRFQMEQQLLKIARDKAKQKKLKENQEMNYAVRDTNVHQGDTES